MVVAVTMMFMGMSIMVVMMIRDFLQKLVFGVTMIVMAVAVPMPPTSRLQESDSIHKGNSSGKACYLCHSEAPRGSFF
jgi:hypothetical protein